MIMKYKVVRIGNSQGIRLPIRQYGNMIGTDIDINVITNEIKTNENSDNVITNKKKLVQDKHGNWYWKYLIQVIKVYNLLSLLLY